MPPSALLRILLKVEKRSKRLPPLPLTEEKVFALSREIVVVFQHIVLLLIFKKRIFRLKKEDFSVKKGRFASKKGKICPKKGF